MNGCMVATEAEAHGAGDAWTNGWEARATVPALHGFVTPTFSREVMESIVEHHRATVDEYGAMNADVMSWLQLPGTCGLSGLVVVVVRFVDGITFVIEPDESDCFTVANGWTWQLLDDSDRINEPVHETA